MVYVVRQHQPQEHFYAGQYYRETDIEKAREEAPSHESS
jgi:hypothetical protein